MVRESVNADSSGNISHTQIAYLNSKIDSLVKESEKKEAALKKEIEELQGKIVELKSATKIKDDLKEDEKILEDTSMNFEKVKDLLLKLNNEINVYREEIATIENFDVFIKKIDDLGNHVNVSKHYNKQVKEFFFMIKKRYDVLKLELSKIDHMKHTVDSVRRFVEEHQKHEKHHIAHMNKRFEHEMSGLKKMLLETKAHLTQNLVDLNDKVEKGIMDENSGLREQFDRAMIEIDRKSHLLEKAMHEKQKIMANVAQHHIQSPEVRIPEQTHHAPKSATRGIIEDMQKDLDVKEPVAPRRRLTGRSMKVRGILGKLKDNLDDLKF